jgi:septum formation protein
MTSPLSSTPQLPEIVLASASPRRRELLASLNLSFTVVPADVDEGAIEAEHAHLPVLERVERLALAKVEAVAQRLANPQALVIGSDTTVVLDERMLGKPTDAGDAFAMLKRLQGREHTVITAIALSWRGESRVASRRTRVWMRDLDDAEIRRYIATGEPMDKAGAYAIQGFGSLIVDRIEGCYFNVVGFSLPLFGEMMAGFGLELF